MTDVNSTCPECAGAGVSRLFSGRCHPCRGTGRILVSTLLSTHEGVCTLAQMVAHGLLTVEKIREALEIEVPDRTMARWRGEQALESIPTFARNPCIECGSFQLQKEWIGSGFCSRQCCESQCAEVGDPDELDATRAYAKQMLECWRLTHAPEKVSMATETNPYPVLVEVNGRSYNLSQPEIDRLWDAEDDNHHGLVGLTAWMQTFGFRLQELGLVHINAHNGNVRLSSAGTAVVAAHRKRVEDAVARLRSRGARATLRERGIARPAGEIVLTIAELEGLLNKL